MKKHIYFIAGQVFIWLIPIVCLVIMACSGTTTKIQIQTWGVVALVVAVAIYYIKGKKELDKVKDRQIIKDGFVHWWVRLINWVITMIPFIAILLILETIKTDIEQAYLFVMITMVSISIGYICLTKDSKDKEKENKGGE